MRGAKRRRRGWVAAALVAVSGAAVAIAWRDAQDDGLWAAAVLAVAGLGCATWLGGRLVPWRAGVLPAAAMVERAAADADAAETGRQRLEYALVVGRHGLFEFDLRDGTIVVSEGFAEILGATKGALSHVSLLEDVLDGSDHDAFRAAYRLIAIGLARRAAGDYRFRDVHGRHVWLHCRFDVVERGTAAAPARLLVVATDVTERKHREFHLQRLALHDPLTGLSNRAAFLERSTLDGLAGNTLLLVDLDAFKQVNDAHGHVVGDAWLVEVARRLEHTVRQGDVVARIGGDEFAVMPAGRLDPATIEELCARIVSRMNEPFAIDGERITSAGASVGAAFIADPQRRLALRTLYGWADAALYAAKHDKDRRFAVRPGDGDAAVDRA